MRWTIATMGTLGLLGAIVLVFRDSHLRERVAMAENLRKDVDRLSARLEQDRRVTTIQVVREQAEPSATPSVAEPGEPEVEAMADPVPLSSTEIVQQRDEAFARESHDPSWARQAERDLWLAFQDTKVAGVRLHRVECRSISCRVETGLSREGSLQELAQDLFINGPNGEPKVPHDGIAGEIIGRDNRGESRAVFHVARKHEEALE